MFILGLKAIINIIMITNIPDISKQIYKEDMLSVIENRYSTLGPMWVSHQLEWNNGVYASFKDHDKFLIVIFLINKTLNFYSRNFIKLSYLEFYSKETVEIEKFSISEVSQELNIPKESARRKVLELENEGILKNIKKKIYIDRSKYYYTKPEDSIKRVSRFLSTLASMSVNEKIFTKKITSEELELIIKKNFSYIWKIYYELQIPMMISYKKVFKDLESFHIFGTCIVNQHLYVRKYTENNLIRESFINTMIEASEMEGINAMSISDITGIPRATVIRKLQKMLREKVLKIDLKKHYRLTGNFSKKLMPIQKDVLLKLANFSSLIFNLVKTEKNTHEEKKTNDFI